MRLNVAQTLDSSTPCLQPQHYREMLSWLHAAGAPKQTAKVAVRAQDGGLTWSNCVVLEVDTQHNRYLVQQQAAGISRAASPMPGTPSAAGLDLGNSSPQTPGSRGRASIAVGLARASVAAGATLGPPFWVPRVQLCFNSEDPSVYAERFAAAHAGLAAADTQLAFELCVDSMPVEDVPQLTTEQVNRVLAWALNTQKLQEKLMDTSSLINEANLEHARTLNKVMLQALVAARETAADAAAAGQGCAAAEQLLPVTVPPATSSPAPTRVEMPAGYDFKEQLSEFAFKTLLTRPEVISALSKIRQESTKVRTRGCLWGAGAPSAVGLQPSAHAIALLAVLCCASGCCC
jgi:dynein heavy chain